MANNYILISPENTRKALLSGVFGVRGGGRMGSFGQSLNSSFFSSSLKDLTSRKKSRNESQSSAGGTLYDQLASPKPSSGDKLEAVSLPSGNSFDSIDQFIVVDTSQYDSVSGYLFWTISSWDSCKVYLPKAVWAKINFFYQVAFFILCS